MLVITAHSRLSKAGPAFDNGGHLFNLLSRAGDGTITAGELRKASPDGDSVEEWLLYFEMAIADLPRVEQEALVARFSSSLQSTYRTARPLRMTTAQLIHAPGGCTAIVEGRARRVGTVRVTDATPERDLYALRSTLGGCRVMAPSASTAFDGEYLRVGGVLRTLSEDLARAHGRVVLEGRYCTPIDPAIGKSLSDEVPTGAAPNCEDR